MMIRLAICAAVALAASARPADADDAAGTFAALRREADRKEKDLQARSDRAAADLDRDALRAEAWAVARSVADRTIAWAEAHRDDPDSVDALVWTVYGLLGYRPEYDAQVRRAFDLLADRALDDEKVAPVCFGANDAFMACPEALHFLEMALEKSRSRLVRGAACLGLARDARLTARVARRLRDPITARPVVDEWSRSPGVLAKLAAADPDALDARAEGYYARAVAEFGDLRMPEPYGQDSFAEQARDELDTLTHLSAGRKPPELVGDDVRGGKARLADHRGKVVMVTFWARWSGPCMEIVPSQRELVARMKGRPFALIGVNGDESLSIARRAMDEHGMTWPSVWDDGAAGVNATAWKVRNRPTIYVLDAEGRIRHDDLAGDDLDKAVDRLVAETEAVPK